MIIFVGSNPSCSGHLTEAFSCCKSATTLESWIRQMKLPRHLCSFANIYNKPTPNNRPLTKSEITAEIPRLRQELNGNCIIALGKTAHAALCHAGISHHELTHPSGCNRLCNDKEWLSEELQRAAVFIHSWFISHGTLTTEDNENGRQHHTHDNL